MKSNISRRDFLKGSAMGALGLAAAGLVSPVSAMAEEKKEAFEKTVNWDAEYDAVVIGFGGAGASVAITAADAGAKVLLLEKAPEGKAGGNSVICMQWICGTSDKAETVKYIKALRGKYTTPSDEMIELYVDGMAENFDWIKSLGAEDPQYFNYCEFPELEGSSSFTPFTVAGNTGMSATAFGGDGAAYHLLKDNVNKRDNITVWYEAEASRLIQDGETKIVHGVTVKIDGREVNVRAKNAVVLACGGFENNKEMQQDFTDRYFWPSTGNAHYNTGDGIRMASDVGADLWHMGNVVSNIEFYDEANEYATFAFQGTGRGIMVGLDGKRFAAEDAPRRHGKFNVGGTWQNSPLPEYMYSIFDENGRAKGRLHFTWSEDSQAEIDKGWIVKADTLEELAQKIGLDADAVVASVNQVEQLCGWRRGSGLWPHHEPGSHRYRAVLRGEGYAVHGQYAGRPAQGSQRPGAHAVWRGHSAPVHQRRAGRYLVQLLSGQLQLWRRHDLRTHHRQAGGSARSGQHAGTVMDGRRQPTSRRRRPLPMRRRPTNTSAKARARAARRSASR